MPAKSNGNLVVKWVGLAVALTLALTGAVATIYSTFETKAVHQTDFEKIDAKLDQLIWYHVQLQQIGLLHGTEGPHVAITEGGEDEDG